MWSADTVEQEMKNHHVLYVCVIPEEADWKVSFDFYGLKYLNLHYSPSVLQYQ